ncbi:MAG: cation:proton antiporter [Candidatus Micrarchaeia archaeon]|jgi:Kef-type K+ transport system membrane component KefB
MDPLLEIASLAVIATIIAIIARMLKQPLIIAYILCGILAGPYVLNLIQSKETLDLFSHIGIALLLFIVGLGLSPKVIREVGKVSTITGVGQVIFTSVFGFLICQGLGFGFMESVYLSIALTFSSTIIIMKILTDKGDTETLYGKIAIGFLIVQDLIAVFILLFLSSMQGGTATETSFIETIILGILLLLFVFFAGYFAIPKITKIIASSQETLLLFSVGWCLALASLFQYFSFSMEIGALLAGVSLSISPYRFEISSKMRSLRDFFIIIFFILLGSQMAFSDVSDKIIPIIILSIFILVGNPLIVIFLMGQLGYTKRTSFLAGLTVAQISEFSIILIALGIKLGHLSFQILSIITFVGLITIAGSTYMILYSNRIYPCISNYLTTFEKKGKKVDEHKYQKYKDYEIILFGYNRIGYDLAKSFKKIKKRFVVIDYNPDTIISLSKENMDCIYGDAGDSEFLSELDLKNAKMVFSTIPDFDTNMVLLNRIRKENKHSIVFLISHQIEQAIELYSAGATYVVLPHFLGGHHASTLIEHYKFDAAKFMKEREKQIKKLYEKQKMGYEHPVHEKNGD